MFAEDVKIEKLRRVPLFSECSKRQLAQIAAIADELDFPADRTLIKEGEAGPRVLRDRRRQHRTPTSRPPNPAHGRRQYLRRNGVAHRRPTERDAVDAFAGARTRDHRQGLNRLLNDQPGIQRKILASLAARLAAVD